MGLFPSRHLSHQSRAATLAVPSALSKPRWEGLLEVISASMEEMKVEAERHPLLLTEVPREFGRRFHDGLMRYVSHLMTWVCLKRGGRVSGMGPWGNMIRQWILEGQPIFSQNLFPQVLDIILCE